jgi:hypothetical protein
LIRGGGGFLRLRSDLPKTSSELAPSCTRGGANVGARRERSIRKGSRFLALADRLIRSRTDDIDDAEKSSRIVVRRLRKEQIGRRKAGAERMGANGGEKVDLRASNKTLASVVGRG